MSFDKDKYWENRKAGKRGQGEDKPVLAHASGSIPAEAKIGFSLDGKLVINNRAYRRQRVRTAPKTSQLRKKNKRKK